MANKIWVIEKWYDKGRVCGSIVPGFYTKLETARYAAEKLVELPEEGAYVFWQGNNVMARYKGPNGLDEEYFDADWYRVVELTEVEYGDNE